MAAITRIAGTFDNTTTITTTTTLKLHVQTSSYFVENSSQIVPHIRGHQVKGGVLLVVLLISALVV
jgi:hypothetical protein